LRENTLRRVGRNGDELDFVKEFLSARTDGGGSFKGIFRGSFKIMSQESRVESRESKTEDILRENENPQTAVRTPQTRIPLFTDEPQTLAEIFLQAKEKHNRPDALNYKRGGEWKKISSDEMVARAENIALGLYSLGLRKGDRAAILAANSPEWTLSDAGCQFAGIIDVPIYTTLSPNSIEYILKVSGEIVLFIQ
jgi:hypothetical protein